MLRDLRDILLDWEYEPGKISVRKIIGRDGRDKIQTRVDLGLLQLEITGRPDGAEPGGSSTLLDHLERELTEFVNRTGDDADFVLSADDAAELRHEAYLFYQRFLALFVLEDFDEVERDTGHNLRILDFCRRYGASDAERNALEPQRPYVTMMNGRARSLALLQRREPEAALQVCDATQRLLTDLPDLYDQAELPEIRLLAELRARILAALPSDSPSRLQAELGRAILAEDYEHAAQIRDRLATTRRRVAPSSRVEIR